MTKPSHRSLTKKGDRRIRNFGVPGYSTDQELLLIESEVLPTHPALLLLVVYLGNDLLDNLRFKPLQVSALKPRFDWTNEALVLRLIPGPEEAAAVDPRPADMVIGPGSRYRWRQTLEEKSNIAALISRLLPTPDLHVEFETVLGPSVTLFDHLLARIKQDCLNEGVPLVLAVLGSRTVLDNPFSATGQYQTYCHRSVLKVAERQKIPVIDVVEGMRRHLKTESHPEPWFHPNEGHLTSHGHKVVAQILDEALKDGMECLRPASQTSSTESTTHQ